jgi:hypothetical protein
MDALTIGQLGQATDTKIETIRYYEKIGLLPKPRRTAGNYRNYAVEHSSGSASSVTRGNLASRLRTCVGS